MAPFKGKTLRASDAKLSASSFLCEKNGFCHRPGRLIDKDRETAWCEGAPGKGVGEKLVFELKKKTTLTEIAFLPFYAKSQSTFFENARAKELEIRTDDGTFSVEFSVEDPVSDGRGRLLDHSHPYVEFASDPKVKRAIRTSRIEIVVKAVYPGTKYNDLCLSELQPYLLP